MAKFSPTEAVFAGFAFARRRPASILIWSAYYLVVLVIALVALFDLAGGKLQGLIALQQSGSADPNQMLALMDGMMPALGFATLILVVFGSVMRSAVIRNYLEPGPHVWGGLRFGGDELRVLGGYAMFILAMFLAMMGLSTATQAVASASKEAGALVMLIGLLLIAGLAVRLSLASVVAFKEKRVGACLRRSWTLTGGSFWRLVGAYVLVIAICAVILIVVLVLFGCLMAAAAVATGGNIADVGVAMRRDYEGLHPVLIGLDVLLNLAQVWLSVVFLVVGLGVEVEAYRTFATAKPDVDIRV